MTISALGFGVWRILGSTAWQCTWKVRFYKSREQNSEPENGRANL